MRKGFTLIELLIVIVLIGILAALVLPKFGDVKERAYKAAMQNDLRNLVTAQEIYFDQNDKYAQTPDEAGLALSKGVTIEISSNSNYLAGYTAEASHKGTEVTCTLHNEDTDQGSRIKCSDEPDDNEN